MGLQDILWAALQRPPSERRSYLDEACGGDAKLRDTAEDLLKSHEEAGSFLEQPAVERASALALEFAAGTRIGPYRLLEPIGEGGMGTVWRAEQERPVKREVALKVMRPWMASREFVARFEAERQTLALMDHQNIARVFDAGTVGEAPYLVMELVQGAPLTRFCDERSMLPRGRLELLIRVSRAVQHAHERGVIHRDLKPTNVLVGLHDGEPVPKVIDFGVAKAIGGRLADQTLHTEAGQVIGTLEYMSPEQARLDAGGVDIRSDVYALGVLLYELLTGTTPLERVRALSLVEGLRVVETEEPPSPSARLSSMERSVLAEVARRRGTTAERLRRSVQGDLDWIAMKCLEKDRLRRYASASALAEDLERHLAHRPVAARPPSAAYRLRKLVRRHPTASALCGASALLVVLALGFAFRVQADRAERALRLGRIGSEVTAALREANSEADRASGLTEDLTAWQGALGSAFATLRRAQSFLAQGGSDLDPALAREVAEATRKLEADERDRRLLAQIEEFRSEAARVDVRANRFRSSVSAADVVEAFRHWGVDFGVTPGAEVADLVAARPAVLRPVLIAALYEGFSLLDRQTADAARKWFDETIAEIDADPWRRGIRAALDTGDETVIERMIDELDASKHPPALLLTIAANLPQKLAGAALRVLSKTQHAYPSDFWANETLAHALGNQERYEEAIRYHCAALAVRPGNAGVWLNLGHALRGRQPGGEEEIRAFERALALEPRYTSARVSLGKALWDAGRLDQAIAMCRTAVECDPEDADAQHMLGGVLHQHGERAEGLAYMRRAIERAPERAGYRAALGLCLYGDEDLECAVIECRKAAALDPANFIAVNTLGCALLGLGRTEDAAATLRAAVALNPADHMAHTNLAMALRQLLDWDGAIEHARKAAALRPDIAAVHLNLGLMLNNTFDSDGAIASYRRALEIDPAFVEAAISLAGNLLNSDRASEAVEVLESIDRRLAAGDPRRASLNLEHIRNAARMAARLSDVLEGREDAGEGQDRVGLVQAAAARRLFRAAARLAEALEGDARFAEDPYSPFFVARCTASAAAGEGDASGASETERAAWRARTLRSLRLSLDGWRAAARHPKADRLVLRSCIDICRRDPAFAALREPRLSELPEEEREAWRRFWSELDEVLALTWKRPEPIPPEKRPGYLGAQLEDVTVEGGKVVRIARVLDDSPAAAAGLRQGDVVVRLGSAEVSTVPALIAAIRGAGAGASVEVEIVRGGKRQSLPLKLGVNLQALLEEPDRSPGMLPVTVERDLSYALGDGPAHERHKLNLFLPQTEGTFPIVLWIHAGAWSYGDRANETALAMRFAERGVGFAAMSYRLSSRFWNEPAAPKEGFRHPAHAEDCAMAFAWLRQRFPESPLFLSGHSCGAHLAALLALDPRYLRKHDLAVGEIRGVIAIGGGYDLVKYHAILADGLEGEPGLGKEKADAHLTWIFGDTEADWIAASPTTHLKGCKTPMLVVAEREPSMRRYTMDFEEAAKAAGVTSIRFRYMEDRTHGDSSPLMSRKAPDPVRDEAIGFIRELSR